jgi:hypothetical protein
MFQPALSLPRHFEMLECLYRKETNDPSDAGAVHRIQVDGQIWCLKQISTEKRYAVRSIRRFEESFPVSSPIRRNSLLIGHHGHRIEGDKLLYFQEYLPQTTALGSSPNLKDPAFRSRLALDVLLLQRRLLQAQLVFADLDERNLVIDQTGRLRILDLEGLLCADDARVMGLFFSFYSVNLASLLMDTVLQTGWNRGRFLQALGCPLFHREKLDPQKVRDVARKAAGERAPWVPALEAILGQDLLALAPEFYEYLVKLVGATERIAGVDTREKLSLAPSEPQPSVNSAPQVSPIETTAGNACLRKAGTSVCATVEQPKVAALNTVAAREPVEQITWNGQHVATIIRKDYLPDGTTFVTPDNYYQQAGMVVYPKGGIIKRHLHLPIQRHLVGTSEALLVKKGRVEADLHAIDKSLLGTWILEQGDLILLAGGGHGFRCLEDTVLMEIKQGPYTGLVEKEHF